MKRTVISESDFKALIKKGVVVKVGNWYECKYSDHKSNLTALDVGQNMYEDLIRAANYVIIMTVKCGKSGQVLQASALELIPQVRRLNPDVIIIVDGGVNENNINLLKTAGVDVAVVGNYAKKCYENGNLAIGINRLLHN